MITDVVLIESDWNLKINASRLLQSNIACINRIRLEFKACLYHLLSAHTYRINRIRLEFKVGYVKRGYRVARKCINRIRLEFKASTMAIE